VSGEICKIGVEVQCSAIIKNQPMGFEVYRRYLSEEEAKLCAEILNAAHIETILEAPAQIATEIITGEGFNIEWLLKIKAEDFTAAERLLQKSEEMNPIDLEAYYLNDFSNDELMDILNHFDEWSSMDYETAVVILESRGKKIPAPELDQLKAGRLEEIRKPKQITKLQIAVAAFFILLGGIVGFAMGYNIMNEKNVDPLGNQYYTYDSDSRKIGKNIFIVGVLFFIGQLITVFVMKYKTST